jgi:hypothetical protein
VSARRFRNWPREAGADLGGSGYGMSIGAWLIPPLALLAGWLAWSRLAPGADERDDLLEMAFAVVVAAMLMTAVMGLLLSELGYLRPWVLSGSLAAIGLTLVMRPRQWRRGSGLKVRDFLAVLLLAGFVAATVAPASEDLLGGRDPGVYANTAAWLAREGTIRIRSDPLATMPAEARPLFNRGILLMGFYVSNEADGEISPQFLHLLPVSMAVGYWLGGVHGAFLVPPFFGLLAALAVFFFTRRLLGVGPAVIAAAILAFNLAQIWAVRNPYSEGATQLAVFAALWCIGRAFETDGMRWGVLGGASLGACFLARIDSPLLLAGIAPALVVLQASAPQPQRWATHAFLPLAVLLAAWGAAHGWMFSRPYVSEHAGFLAPLWGVTTLTVLLSAAALVQPYYVRPFMRGVYGRGKGLWIVAAIALTAAFAVGMWVRPHLQPFQMDAKSAARTYNEETLVRVGWYLSASGMVLGLAGVLLLLRRWLVERSAQWSPFLFILLPFAGLYFWRQSIYPDHPWAMRRFLPVIVPGICVGIAAATSWLWERRRLRPLARSAAVVAIAAVAWHEAVMIRPFWNFREKGGVIDDLSAFAAQIPHESLILYSHPGQEVIAATPLALTWGRDVLPVMRLEDDRFGRQRESEFQEQVIRWLKQGRDVLYLTFSNGDSVYMTPGVRWVPAANLNLTVPTIGSSVERAPQRPKSYALPLQLLRAVLIPGSRSACVQTLPRMGEPLLGIAQGLYGPEGRGGYRWTMPQSRVVFPPCDRSGAARPRAVRVFASCGRRAPPGQCRVNVALNGTPLGSLDLVSAFTEFDLHVPASAVLDPAAAVDVRFDGSRFVPAEAGVNEDRRELSFQLGGVMLLDGSR